MNMLVHVFVSTTKEFSINKMMRQKWQTFSPLVPCAKTPFPSNPRPLSPPSPPRKTRSNQIPRKKNPCPTDNKQLPTFFEKGSSFFSQRERKTKAAGSSAPLLSEKPPRHFVRNSAARLGILDVLFALAHGNLG